MNVHIGLSRKEYKCPCCKTTIPEGTRQIYVNGMVSREPFRSVNHHVHLSVKCGFKIISWLEEFLYDYEIMKIVHKVIPSHKQL